jgi:hypothetical protein
MRTFCQARIELLLHRIQLLLQRPGLLAHVHVGLDRFLAEFVELAGQVTERLLELQRIGRGFH